MLLFISGCGLLDPDDDYLAAYPRAYPILSQAELDSLKNDFRSQNGDDICVEFDKFGITGWINSCSVIGSSALTDSAGSITLAKELLARNSHFIGVTDIDKLVVAHVSWARGDNETLAISFNPQFVGELEILESSFVVYVTNEGVSGFIGSWFTDVIIPRSNRITANQAEQELVGYELTYYCCLGTKISFIVEEDMIREGTEKYIVQTVIEDRLELRVAWRITIEDSSAPSLYVDTTTGEIFIRYTSQVIIS